jgi:hypothetical protein
MIHPVRSKLYYAIKARLDPLLRANGNYADNIGRLTKPLRVDSSEDIDMLADVLNGQAPAFMIHVGKRTAGQMYVDGIKRTFADVYDVSIYVVSVNAESLTTGRFHDDTSALPEGGDPGIDAMLRDAENLLAGFVPAELEGAHFMRITSDEYVWLDHEMAVYEQAYTIMVDRDLNAENPCANLPLTAQSIQTKHGINNLELPLLETLTVLNPI